MRLGILGGSFDPVHYAHLLMAEICREACQLDQVWFLPAAVAPHKQNHQVSDALHRVEMLKLAIGGHSSFRVSDLELKRGGVSYTVETLRHIRSQQPDDNLFFIMGADSLRDFPTWRQPEKICELAMPLIVARPDWPNPDYRALAALVGPERAEQIQRSAVTIPLMQLSSTEIRQRVSQQQSIRFRLPRAVEKYIEANRLYRG
ncbi:MAG: nicotinate-nucleotide adenylyltransferase [Pirellulaceae bacterium]|nr:nicotinate-nucleotide adenylyltransferase [Pirellulaceae bacterium]